MFVLAEALLTGVEDAQRGLGQCGQPAVPVPACCARGRERDLTGFLAIRPMPLPCSKTPAEPTETSPLAVLSMLPPGYPSRRPQRVHNLEADTGLQHPLSTLHERRCRRPCKTRFRLAGCAFTGRGSNPLDRFERFQVTFHPPFQDFACRKGRLRQLNTVADAYQFAVEWCGNSAGRKAAVRACKAAPVGDVYPETARRVFIAVARKKDILLSTASVPSPFTTPKPSYI